MVFSDFIRALLGKRHERSAGVFSASNAMVAQSLSEFLDVFDCCCGARWIFLSCEKGLLELDCVRVPRVPGTLYRAICSRIRYMNAKGAPTRQKGTVT